VALGIVESILLENDTLKGHTRQIEAELDKARSLSSGLLRENESLRSLYKERTRDIFKLVKSISIQNDEDKGDYQHQCHLIQELNYATLKQIKALDQRIQDSAARTAQQQAEVDQVAALKNELEHDCLNKLRVRINNGLSH
jgi:chromosome segregation ATPase